MAAKKKGFKRKSGASSEIPSSSMADIAFLLTYGIGSPQAEFVTYTMPLTLLPKLILFLPPQLIGLNF